MGHNPAQIQTLQQDRCNQAFLPDVPFPDTLLLEADLARALAASRDVLVVVPSHVFGDVLRQLKPHLRPDARIVWATKGLEAETGRLLQDVAREALGETIPLAVLSGPTFAKELAAGLPTAIALAATDAQFADDLQQLLHCGKSFRVYSNPDFIGVQLGGAVKNVIAIGAGMSDGIGFGANARTALITRGLAEMSRLGSALGADPSTFMGMAGWGSGANLHGQPIAQPPLRYYAGAGQRRTGSAGQHRPGGRGLSQYQRGVGAGAAARRGNADHRTDLSGALLP